MMNPNILNKNPLMFFDRAVNAQRSQLLTVMADAVSECRTAADQAAELNETGQVGLLLPWHGWRSRPLPDGAAPPDRSHSVRLPDLPPCGTHLSHRP